MYFILTFCFASLMVSSRKVKTFIFYGLKMIITNLKKRRNEPSDGWKCEYIDVIVTRVTKDKISTYPVVVRCSGYPLHTQASVTMSRERILKSETISFRISPPCEGYFAIIIYNTRQCDRVALKNNKEECLVKPEHNYAALCLHHREGDSYTVVYIPGADVDYDPSIPRDGANLFFIKFDKLF